MHAFVHRLSLSLCGYHERAGQAIDRWLLDLAVGTLGSLRPCGHSCQHAAGRHVCLFCLAASPQLLPGGVAAAVGGDLLGRPLEKRHQRCPASASLSAMSTVPPPRAPHRLSEESSEPRGGGYFSDQAPPSQIPVDQILTRQHRL